MNVLFVVAEMAPLAKVGGVADVAGSLPQALRSRDVDVRIALPYYRTIKQQSVGAERLATTNGGALWRCEVDGIPVYLVEHPAYSDRGDIYGGEDETDRFLAFCDTLLAGAGALDWPPDVLHLHDWQPGFVALRLAAQPEHPWSDAALVYTIHNLAFAGAFDAAFSRRHGVDNEALAAAPSLDDRLRRSALAQALLRADLVSTVSPTYAREIQTEEYAHDFAPLLRGRGEGIAGVLNGIDTRRFNPATDPDLATRFDADSLDRRIENKRALQQRMGLPADDDAPLLGMVARLFWQKGADLLAGAVESLVPTHHFQLVVLGRGDREQEETLARLAQRHPGRIAVRLAFDAPLGQLIYAGSDAFLMPSRYEPCGLGQMIAMRYGSVPVVRRTGGLADSVEPYAPGAGTGFVFEEPTPRALADALEKAIAVYDGRGNWHDLQRRCMAQDWSWDRAARQYVELYERAIDRRAERVGASP